MGQRRGNGLSESRPRVAHLQRPLRRETALKFSKLTQPPPPAACLCHNPSKPISCSPRETWPLSHRLCAHLLRFSRTARPEAVTTRGLKHSLKPAKSPPTPEQNLKGSCDRLFPHRGGDALFGEMHIGSQFCKGRKVTRVRIQDQRQKHVFKAKVLISIWERYTGSHSHAEKPAKSQ